MESRVARRLDALYTPPSRARGCDQRSARGLLRAAADARRSTPSSTASARCRRSSPLHDHPLVLAAARYRRCLEGLVPYIFSRSPSRCPSPPAEGIVAITRTWRRCPGSRAPGGLHDRPPPQITDVVSATERLLSRCVDSPVGAADRRDSRGPRSGRRCVSVEAGVRAGAQADGPSSSPSPRSRGSSHAVPISWSTRRVLGGFSALFTERVSEAHVRRDGAACGCRDGGGCHMPPGRRWSEEW